MVALAHAIACSDDGVPATTDDPSTGSTGATNPTDPTNMTGTTAESSATDTSPESTGTGTTADDTSGTATSPTETSGTTDPDTGSTTGEGACVDAEGCEVVDDCCSCIAIPAGAEPPVCEKPNCLQSACAAAGIIPIAQCELGTCELIDGSCDPDLVICDSKPPVCPKGTQPGVDPVAQCWTNSCVPEDLCDVVPGGCDACEPDEVCVQNVAQMVTSMCVPLSPECEGTPTCACMGDVCEEPFGTCNDEGAGIDCICIAC